MSCDKSVQKIKNIFDEISSYYDIINNFISLWSHLLIKYISVKMLDIPHKSNILDLCCGTGDFTKIFSKFYSDVKIIGLDSSIEMIKLAKIKNPKGSFVVGDSMALPFKNAEFDIITMGFGLRNIQDRKRALSESYRVLKNGGEFLHLDFGIHNIFSKIFDVLVLFVVKLLGKNKEAYLYLIESKKEFPEPDELIKEFEKIGFRFVKRRDFMFGVISAQIYQKYIEIFPCNEM